MSHSERNSYYPAPSNRSSRSSTYYDQDRTSSKSHKRHDSSRSHHDTHHRYAGHKPGTYGTYIYPLDESRRYVTEDPTTCRCNCCPHPKSICRSHAEPPHSTDPYYPNRPHAAAPRKPSSSSSSSSSRHGRSRPSKSDSFVMDVVDGSDSTLARRYGRDYPITLSTSGSSVSSILSFLAPDKRRAKVVVHWRDGEVETLGEQVPLKELRMYGRYLEVRKEKKKRVHWAC